MGKSSDRHGWSFTTSVCAGIFRARRVGRFERLNLKGRSVNNLQALTERTEALLAESASAYFRAKDAGVSDQRMNRKRNRLAELERKALWLRSELSALTLSLSLGSAPQAESANHVA